MPRHHLTHHGPATALRVAALALLIVFTLTAAACDAPGEEIDVHRDDFGLRPTPTPVQVEVHRDDFGLRPTPTPTPVRTQPPIVTPTPTPTDAYFDRAVLVTLYRRTRGLQWTTDTNWLSDAPLNTWHGVTTDGNGRVTQLSLPRNRLSGRIPPELGNLSNLERLVLAENQLEGPIPPELGRLANLKSLWLNDNHLKGAIPSELANLSSLDELVLGGTNHLSGCIPEVLGIARHSDFAALRLPYCDLNGRVPKAAGPRPTTAPETTLAAEREVLVELYHVTDGPNWVTSSNWLSNAPLDEWHGVVTDPSGRVVELRLPDNQLAGVIPLNLGKLTHLELLALSRNRLIGTIPPQLSSLSRLSVLTLYGNQLSGEIPPKLGDLGRLRWLDLNTNQLQGTIPSELGRLSKLETLDLSINRLTGPVPPALGRLSLLEGLKLNGNQLHGAIPAELTGLSRLYVLALGGGNDLTGCIPETLRAVPLSDVPNLGLPLCGPS